MKVLYLSSLVLSIFLSSCSKEKEQEKLINSWSKVFLSASETGRKVIWTFDEGNTLFATEYRTDTTIIDTASYKVQKDFPNIFYIDITGLQEEQDGRYQIIKLKKDILVIERISSPDGKKEGAYLWKEFIKKSD